MTTSYSDIYNVVFDHLVAKLQNQLSPQLTYHSIDHTLDVLARTQQIAANENITNEEEILLLKIAALYHDTGFIVTYSGHEEKGCELAKTELPQFELNNAQIEKICGMIMATKIPQLPANKLEEILCDADLDYLGRNDFEPISNSLYKEFLAYSIVKNYEEWMLKQISFFESHHYFSESVQRQRNPEKMKHLVQLKVIIDQKRG